MYSFFSSFPFPTCFSLLLSMEDITKGWNPLSLSKREGDHFQLKKKHHWQDFSIFAKFLTKRALNLEAVARTFKPIWHTCNVFQT